VSRETATPLVIVVGVLCAIGGGYAWLDARREAVAAAAHETREHEREAAEAHRWDELRTESRELLAGVIGGVELGMDVASVIAARPRDAVEASTSHVDPGYELYEEHLPSGAQVMYAFDQDAHRLVRVQALSQLDTTEAIPPHLAALNDRYGAPTGIWDCHDAGGFATRRFTWRRSHVGLADILLVYGDRISVTLYVTTNEQMGRSLERARCAPVTVDHIDQLPTTSPDQIRRAAAEEESRP
jgi:hypothetical protein